MGEFEKEKIVLKKEARKGQLFSGTKYIEDLAKLQKDQKEIIMEEIPDIERKNPNTNEVLFTFSDGIGNISAELAALIDKQYSLTLCSAYQVRLGGIKGVLMRDINLEGYKV